MNRAQQVQSEKGSVNPNHRTAYNMIRIAWITWAYCHGIDPADNMTQAFLDFYNEEVEPKTDKR